MLQTSKLIYNESVTNLNSAIRMFPSSIIARMVGFSKRSYLESTNKKTKICNENTRYTILKLNSICFLRNYELACCSKAVVDKVY